MCSTGQGAGPQLIPAEKISRNKIGETPRPNPRWKIKPAGSTWGDFGPDDQLGRLNLVTPEKVKQGVAEVREGKSLLPLAAARLSGRQRAQPAAQSAGALADAARRQAEHDLSALARRPEAGRCRVRRRRAADAAIFDAMGHLAHVGQQFDVDGDGKPEMVFYNGFRAGEHIVGPVDYRGGKEAATGGHMRRDAARRREHGAHLRAGPRRDDRPARAFRPRRARWSATTT